MDLILIRHGIAEERIDGRDDPKRALTKEGRSRCLMIAEFMASRQLQLGALLHSPWARAAQTAECFAPLASSVEVSELLIASPGEALRNRLRTLGKRAALVGHEPWMSELASKLLSHDDFLPLWFKKGGFTWLRGRPSWGEMEMVAWVPPRLSAGVRQTKPSE